MIRQGSRIVAVSMFIDGENSGHLIADDEAYFDYLVERRVAFVFYTSAYSAARLTARHPAHAALLRPLPSGRIGWRGHLLLASSIVVEAGDRVIFFGFAERSLLAFVARNLFRSYALVLVATNNFSARRYGLYARRQRMFLQVVAPWLERLVVHTRFERDLVERLVPAMRSRTCIKKHHLMTPRSVERRPSLRPTICYFGPVKPEKPVTPLVDLLHADTTGKFVYRVFNVDPPSKQALLAAASQPDSIVFVDDWLADGAYQVEAASAALILLTHNAGFEGKLSGNLCASVALGVPFLADCFEPVSDYLRTYGPVGFQYDFRLDGWAKTFLADFSTETWGVRRTAIRAMGDAHADESVRADLDRCLGILAETSRSQLMPRRAILQAPLE